MDEYANIFDDRCQTLAPGICGFELEPSGTAILVRCDLSIHILSLQLRAIRIHQRCDDGHRSACGCAAARPGRGRPSLPAQVLANHSNRGGLSDPEQEASSRRLPGSVVLRIPRLGPLGAAFTVVASDILIQFSQLGWLIMRPILRGLFSHIVSCWCWLLPL